jgi:CheY-like chemotaxis protein
MCRGYLVCNFLYNGRMIILHVDDDFEEREILSEALQSVDPSISFLGAYNGPNAFLKLQDTELPDLIFLDINMPMMDGFEFLTRIKRSSRLSHIPVVVYSTSSAQKDILESFKRGAISYLVKPNDLATLKISLQQVLTGLIQQG